MSEATSGIVAPSRFLRRADWERYAPLDDEAFERSVRPLETIGQLALVTGETTIAAGVTTYPAPGHTPGHQCVMVRSGDEVGVLTGDLFHNPAQVTEQTWTPIWDGNPETAIASRRALLSRIQDGGWTAFSGHLGVGVSIGHVVETDGKPTWRPL